LGKFDATGKSFTAAAPLPVDANYPGVYVLAFLTCSADLAGKRIRESQIDYVGMSSVPLAARIRQFIVTIKGGRGHSCGKRVLSMDAPGKADKPIFVSSISVPCRYAKVERKPLDLQKLGTVAALEWYTLARIKQKTGREPSLNKK
jgi:hypothetical protein